jgi:hypothetical protein
MHRIPKGFAVSLGLSALLTVAAAYVSLRPAPASATASPGSASSAAVPESCVRYGRVECCYKGD